MCRIFVPVAFALTAFASAAVLAQPTEPTELAVATAAKGQRGLPPLTLAVAVQFALQNNPSYRPPGVRSTPPKARAPRRALTRTRR